MERNILRIQGRFSKSSTVRSQNTEPKERINMEIIATQLLKDSLGHLRVNQVSLNRV